VSTEEIDFLTVEDLLEIATGLLDEVSVRDAGLLAVAGCRPRMTVFGAEAYLTFEDKAAALLHSLVRNHALVDGNKRLAWAATRIICILNGRDLAYTVDEAEELMLAADADGEMRSYLTTEENFAVLRDLERKNLIIPVVGNFSGPKAIRSVGEYLSGHDTTVSAFYLSNVEQFLGQDGKWNKFCASASTLPLDDTSVFVRSGRGPNRFGGGGVQNSSASPMLADLQSCVAAAR